MLWKHQCVKIRGAWCKQVAVAVIWFLLIPNYCIASDALHTSDQLRSPCQPAQCAPNGCTTWNLKITKWRFANEIYHGDFDATGDSAGDSGASGDSGKSSESGDSDKSSESGIILHGPDSELLSCISRSDPDWGKWKSDKVSLGGCMLRHTAITKTTCGAKQNLISS